MRYLIALSMVLCSSQACADTDTGSYASLVYEMVFGSESVAAATGAVSDFSPTTALGSMMLIFNLALFTYFTYILFSGLLAKVIQAGNDGKLLSSQYNDTMVVTRSATSLCLMLPVVGGFSLAQMLVLAVSLTATELADEVNYAAAEHVYTHGSIGQYKPDKGKIQALTASIIDSETCAITSNDYYSEHPRYKDRYEIQLKEKPLQDAVAGFSMEFSDPLGRAVCGSIEYIIKNDAYFGRWNAPTGTIQSLNQHQKDLSISMAKAHRNAIVSIHNDITKAFTPGIARPGREIGAEQLRAAITAAVSSYSDRLDKEISAAAETLGKGFSESDGILELAASRGWLYNGLTFLEKSTAESFMSQLAREIPVTEGPNYNLMESALKRERLGRSLRIVRSLDHAPGDSKASETGRNEVESLSKRALAGADYEALIGGWISNKMTALFIDSQFDFEHYDPLTNLQHLGHRMVNTGFIAIATSVGIDAATKAALATAENNVLLDVADLGTGGVISGIKAAGKVFSEKLVTGLEMFGVLFLMVGTVLAYWLPALPFFMWDLAVLGNFVLVIVAFVAAPMLMIANAMPGGHGLSSDSARQGWLTLLTILVRPAIMVMAWHLSLLLMRAMGEFTSIYLGYIPLQNSQALTTLWGAMAGIVIFLIMESVITYRCLSLIYEIPDMVPLYYGGQPTAGNESIGESKGQTMVAGWSNHAKQIPGSGGGASSPGAAKPQDLIKDF